MEDMSAQELADKLQDMAQQWAQMLRAAGAHEPDWAPLEKVLPYNHCGAFMFMGYRGEVRMYKNSFTRRYLNADPKGNTYLYVEDTDSYIKVPKNLAIEHAFSGYKEMGLKRTAKFDEKAQRKRDAALKKAGWTMLRLDPTKAEGMEIVAPDG
jgi:uncharacterized protein YcgL (UPF0745 family)